MKRIYKDEFPAKIDFDYLENLEIEYYPAKVFYKSFFAFLNIPKIIIDSFRYLLTSETEEKSVKQNKHIANYEKQFFKVFDKAYSLDGRYFEKKPNQIHITNQKYGNSL